jgi:hypothetical protein
MCIEKNELPDMADNCFYVYNMRSNNKQSQASELPNMYSGSSHLWNLPPLILNMERT